MSHAIADDLGRASDEAAVDMLRRHGLRATAPRIAIVTILRRKSSTRHRTAKELQQLIGSGAINTTTVYRTLSTLERLGLVHHLTVADGLASYGFSAEPHHHAVCTGCSSVTEIFANALTSALDLAHRDTRFIFADSASVTLHGVCSDCQQKAQPRVRT